MPVTELAAMARRAFVTPAGRTLAFTALGLGGAPLGNLGRAVTDADAEATLAAAWEAGVRYFDTAPLYGHGVSERRVGRAFIGRQRAEFLLSTKVGRLLEPCAPGEEASGPYLKVPPLKVRFDYSRAGVLGSFEASRKRLRLDRVDILFVHDIEAATHGGREGREARLAQLVDCGGWRALEELRAAGDVGAIGLGVNETEACERFLEVADPDLFLLAGRYTLLEQQPLERLFPRCRERGVWVIAGGPFNSGVLARAGGTYDYAAAPTAVVDKVRRLEAVCAAHDADVRAAALQFPLAHPRVATVLAGAQTPGEARGNAAMIAAPLPASLWSDLKGEGLIAAEAPTPC
ncbi:MAG TPA: aldo/keto reductase [Caulobacteraceae bacterium]|nr:aldo/keto reductase [Caulobacteraceae bacterium]